MAAFSSDIAQAQNANTKIISGSRHLPGIENMATYEIAVTNGSVASIKYANKNDQKTMPAKEGEKADPNSIRITDKKGTVYNVNMTEQGAKVSASKDGKPVELDVDRARLVLNNAKVIAGVPLQHGMQQAGGFSSEAIAKASREAQAKIQSALDSPDMKSTSLEQANGNYQRRDHRAAFARQGITDPFIAKTAPDMNGSTKTKDSLNVAVATPKVGHQAPRVGMA